MRLFDEEIYEYPTCPECPECACYVSDYIFHRTEEFTDPRLRWLGWPEGTAFKITSANGNIAVSSLPATNSPTRPPVIVRS